MRIVRVLFATARLGLGPVGCLMMLSGALGVVRVFVDAPWWIGVSSLATAAIGCLIAYSAFGRAPWERKVRPAGP